MITQGKIASHGPLRIILTTDEEEDMTGALAIKKVDVAGIKYLINIDAEESNSVLVSSAADLDIEVTQKPKTVTSGKKTACKITISGLLGGHSGVMINEGRCNGNIALANVLTTLKKSISYDLVSFHGGTADNAIPAKAEAVIQIHPADKKELKQIVKKQLSSLKKKYKGIEPSIKLSVEKTKRSKKTLKRNLTESVLKYATKTIDGIYSMSEDMEGLVESSSNLGRVNVDSKGITLRQMVRSSSTEKMDEIRRKTKKLAKNVHFSFTDQKGSHAWPVNPDSTLVPNITSAYRELTGKDMQVTAIHAGLECGAFSELDPGLDMASIGPDIVGAHSPDETLDLNSVPLIFHLMEKVLMSVS